MTEKMADQMNNGIQSEIRIAMEPTRFNLVIMVPTLVDKVQLVCNSTDNRYQHRRSLSLKSFNHQFIPGEIERRIFQAEGTLDLQSNNTYRYFFTIFGRNGSDRDTDVMEVSIPQLYTLRNVYANDNTGIRRTRLLHLDAIFKRVTDKSGILSTMQEVRRRHSKMYNSSAGQIEMMHWINQMDFRTLCSSQLVLLLGILGMLQFEGASSGGNRVAELGKDGATRLLKTLDNQLRSGSITREDVPFEILNSLTPLSVWLVQQIAGTWLHLFVYFSHFLGVTTVLKMKCKLTKRVNLEHLNSYSDQYFYLVKKYPCKNQQHDLLCALVDSCKDSLVLLHFVYHFMHDTHDLDHIADTIIERVVNVIERTLESKRGTERMDALFKLWKDDRINQTNRVAGFVRVALISMIKSEPWTSSVDDIAELLITQGKLEQDRKNIVDTLLTCWHESPSYCELLYTMIRKDVMELFGENIIESLLKDGLQQLYQPIKLGTNDRGRRNTMKQNYKLLSIICETNCPSIKKFYGTMVFMGIQDVPLEELSANVCDDTSFIDAKEKKHLTDHIIRRLQNEESTLETKTKMILRMRQNRGFGCLMFKTDDIFRIVVAILDTIEDTKTVAEVVQHFTFWGSILTCKGEQSEVVVAHRSVIQVCKLLCDLMKSLEVQEIRLDSTIWSVLDSENRKANLCYLMRAVPERNRTDMTEGTLAKFATFVEDQTQLRAKYLSMRKQVAEFYTYTEDMLSTFLAEKDLAEIRDTLINPDSHVIMNESNIEHFCTRQLLTTSRKLQTIIQSRMFLNICYSIFRNEKEMINFAGVIHDKQYCKRIPMTELWESLVSPGKKLYYFYCNQMFNGNTSLPTTILATLLEGITTLEELNTELVLVKQLHKNDVQIQMRSVLIHFIDRATLNQRVSLSLNVLKLIDNNTEDVQALATSVEAEDMTLSQWMDVMKPVIDLEHSLRCRRDGFGSDKFWNVVIQLLHSQSLLKFLKEIIDEDLRNLIDTVGKHSEEWLDFMDVKQYLTPLLKTTHLNLSDVYTSLLNIPTGLNMNDIPSLMVKCSTNLRLLQELYRSMATRSEITLDVICSALRCGEFCFTWDDIIDECQVLMRYIKGDPDDEIIYGKCPMEELNLLRSRALLIITSTKTQHAQRRDSERMGSNHVSASDLQDFVDYIDIASSLKKMYTDAKAAGFIELEMQIFVPVSDLITYENTLKEELCGWNVVLDKARNECFHLNFFTPKELIVLERFFCGNIEVCENVRLLFQYVYPCFDLRQETRSAYNRPSNFDPGTRLRSIASSLDNIFEGKSKKNRQISIAHTSAKTIDSTVQPGEVYIAHIPEEARGSSISVVMQLCINTTGSYPEPSEIVFCQQETSFQELGLLLRRCSNAATTEQNRRLYLIVDAQNLSSETELLLVDEIRRNQQQKHKHLLLAIICRSDIHVTRQFPLRLTHRLHGISNEQLNACLQTDFHNVEVVTSTNPGLGKTTYIINTAGDKVITAVVGGAMDKSALLKSLGLEIDEVENLHLDVKDMKKPGDFDTFLFELIVVGMASAGDRRCRCSWKSVFIEIANTIEDCLQDSLVTCMMFKRTELEWNDFEDYIIPSDISSPEQMVCRYKQALDGKRINAEDISVDNGDLLSPRTCRHILSELFEDQTALSFASVGNLVSVLSTQLTNLSRSVFLKTGTIAKIANENPNRRVVRSNIVRSDIVQTLIFVAKEITRPPQREPRAAVSYRRGKSATAATMANRYQKMVKWSDSNHLMIVFNRQDHETITTLYRDKSCIPVAVKRLLQSQERKEVPDYNEMSQEDLREILQRVCRKRTIPFDKSKLSGLQEIYVLTPDNILKMMLIMVRIEARVPVIIMGETGCGKTMLITYLALLSEVSLKILRLHAGSTEVEICSFIQTILTETRNEEDVIQREVWVFFDEINTCEHLGILAELICHKKFNGQELPSNVVCIAACNPYRLKKQGQRNIGLGLPEKDGERETNKLVYCVHPLPEAMSDFVWDFGALGERDERIYIERMVKGNITPELEQLFVNLLVISQRFVRARLTNYSVSLRDVDRCVRLNRWMTNDLLTRKGMAKTCSDMSVSLCDEKECRGMLLALAHCYHSRLVEEIDRAEYRQTVSSRCNDSGYHMNDNYIKQVITAEQNDLLRRMKLPSGTANNEALRENVFVILVAIMTKLPVFVVGKPGCSKSLSMNLIEDNLRGSESDDEYFKTLPAVFKLSYQCSESSTSDEIKKVFTRAKTFLREGRQPVVLLDEVGLAERSQYNPLKVLHTLLDPDGGHFPSVAMVGISNYLLDAAKMNRAIHLSRPDPTIEELLDTAKAIRDGLGGISSEIVSSDDKLRELSFAYCEYKKVEQLKNVHGLRDFYSMIKFLTKQPCIPGIADKAFLRNFGGLPLSDSLHILNFLSGRSGIMERPKQRPSVADLINENLNDNSARHLMLVSKGHSGLAILQQILQGRKRVVLCGSNFQNDLTDEYDHRMLSKIVLHMETECILVLQGLESIYGCLYDMLNQSYKIIAGKRFCRVALGANCNLSREVHPNFKCIVLVDDLRECDPPFLNRFEKQSVSFSDVLTDKQKDVVSRLSRQIHDMSIIPNLQSTTEESFVGYHEGTLPSLVIRNTPERPDAATDDILMNRCIKDMLSLATSDAVLRFSSSCLCRNNNDNISTTRRRSGLLSQTAIDVLIPTIQKEYFALPLQKGIKHFMESIFNDRTTSVSFKDPGFKIVLYTHCSIHEDVKTCIEAIRTCHGPLRVHVAKLSVFNSERHLDDWCCHYWTISDANMLVIQCTAALDAPHVLMVKCLTDHYRAEYLTSRQRKVHGPKHICVIIHVDRGTSADKRQQLREFDFLNDWQPFTLETLEEHAYAKTDMTTTTMMSLIDKDLNDIIKEQLWWCFSRIDYTTRHRQVECVFKLITVISESMDLIQVIQERLKRMVTNSPISSGAGTPNWEMEVACNKHLLLECSTMAEARKEYIKMNIRVPLAKIVFAIEKLFAWNSLMNTLTESLTESRHARSNDVNFWLFCFRNIFSYTYTDISDSMGVHSYVIDKPLLDLSFPFFIVFHDKIQNQRWLTDSYVQASTNGISASDESSLCNQLAEIMENEVPELMHTDYITHSFTEYIDDFCNVVSAGYAPGADVRTRVDALKWLLQLYGASTVVSTRTPTDGFHSLAKWYITSWTHERPLQSHIELVITFMQCKQYKLELLLNEVMSEMMSEDEGQPGGASAESDVSNHLVSVVCRAMLPTEDNINACGGINLWRHNTGKILEIAARVNYDSKIRHLLVVCMDLLQLLTKSNMTSYEAITILADAGDGDCSAIERKDVFLQIRHTIDHVRSMRSVPNEELDNFLCLYIARCIDANNQTPLLSDFISVLINGNNELLSGARPVLFTIIYFELRTAQNHKQLGLMELWKNLLVNDLNETPALKCVDEHLQQQEYLDGPLAVACCDVLEDLLSDYISRSTLVNVAIIDVVSDIVKAVTSCTTCSLQLLAAIAFIRIIFKSFAGKFKEGESPDLTSDAYVELTSHIHTLINLPMDCNRMNALQLYFLKCMRRYRTRLDLSTECRHLSRAIPALLPISLELSDIQFHNTLGFDPMSYLCQDKTVESTLLKHHSDPESSSLFQYSRDCPECRLAIIAFAVQHCYLTHSIGGSNVLDETIKSQIQNRAKTWPYLLYALLLQLLRSGNTGFRSNVLQLSEGSTPRNVSIAAVAMHISSICFNTNQPNSFTQYIEQPRSDYILGVGRPVPFGLRMTDQRTCTDSMYYCPCGQVIVLLDSMKRCDTCPTCEQKCHRDNWESETINDNDLFDENDLLHGVRSQSPISYRVIQVLLHSCLLVGYDIHQNMRDTSMTPLATAATMNTYIDLDALSNRVQTEWDMLENLLNLSHEEVGLFLHVIIKDAREVITSPRCSGQTAETRNNLERALDAIVHKQVQRIPRCLKDFLYACKDQDDSTIQSEIDEIDGMDHLAIGGQPRGGFQRILRYSEQATFEDFRLNFLSQSDEFYNTHSLLTLFLHRYQSLQYVKHILNLIEWNQAISSHLCHRLDRAIASSLTHGQILNEERYIPGKQNREELKLIFERYKNSWNSVRDGWRHLTHKEEDLQPMTESQPIIMSLFCRDSPQNLLWRMIEVLQETQNTFLRQVVKQAATYPSHCCKFLTEKNTPTVPYVSLHEARKQDVIHCDSGNICLIFHDIIDSSDRGTCNRYDYVQIENKLVKDIVRNKAILQIHDDTTADFFVFADELFHSCSTILKDVEMKIAQQQLPRRIANSLKHGHGHTKTISRELLEQLEILLGLLKRTGGKPNDLLSDFVKKWYSMLPPKLMSNLIPELRDIKLKHLVDLYQIVEGLLSKESVQSVQMAYCNDIPIPLQRKLDTMYTNTSSVKQLELVLITLERFIFRYLKSGNDIGSTGCLAEVLTSKQYMPSLSDEERNVITVMVLDQVKVSNIRSILMLIKEEIKKRREFRHTAVPRRGMFL